MSTLDQVQALFDGSNSKLKTDLGALIDAANAQVVMLQAQVNDLTTKLNAANDEATNLTAEVTSRDADLASRNSQISDLNAQIATLKAQIVTLQTPAPVPTPPPAPTPGPATTSAFTVNLQGMAEVTPGSGVFKSTNLGAPKANGGQIAVAQARLTKAAQAGQTVVTKYDQTTNVVPDGKKNLKDFRAWPNPSTPYPNNYTGRTLGAGDNSITSENNDGVVAYRSSHPTGWNVAYFHMPIVADKKQHVERTIRLASAPGKSDGYAKIVVDGVTVFESDGFMVNGPCEDFGPQMVYAPISGDSGPLPAGAYFQVENLSVSVA